MIARLEKSANRLNRWTEFALFGLGLGMAVIVAVQVFFRYVLNYSLFWSEELARYILVWLTFLGTSAAYYRHAHPGVDILYSRLPSSGKRVLSVIIDIISIGFFCIMVYFGCRFAYDIRLQISPALSLPKWIVFSVIPLSGMILVFHALTFLLRDLTGGHHDR